MLPGQGVRNFIWFLSIIVGPAIAYVLINIMGNTEWICKKLNLCSIRLFAFYAFGFFGVWALYWACYLIVMAIKSKKAQ